MLLAMETGEHIDSEVLVRVKATAYRLEPLTEQGIYSLDGEVIEYGPVQGVVMPGFVGLFTRI